AAGVVEACALAEFRVTECRRLIDWITDSPRLWVLRGPDLCQTAFNMFHTGFPSVICPRLHERSCHLPSLVPTRMASLDIHSSLASSQAAGSRALPGSSAVREPDRRRDNNF